MAKQTFTTGQVLTAAQMNSLQANDYNWTVDTKTDSYVLVAGDAGKRIVMNANTAKTITVDTSIFTAGDVVWIHNIDTGTCTVTAGTCTVNTAGSLALAQWEGGALYFTSASTAIFFRGGGATYGVATGGSSSNITVSGVNYTLLTFSSTGALTVSRSGLFDVLLCSGGGGGGYSEGGTVGGGGGGAGGILQTTVYLDANTTVTIGAGGAQSKYDSKGEGSSSSLDNVARSLSVAGGGGAGAIFIINTGASRGGSGGGGVAGIPTASDPRLTGATSMAPSISGFAGGNGVSSNSGAGGGGGATAVGNNGVTTTGGAGGAGYDVSAFIGGSSLYKCGGGGGGGGTGGAGGSSVGGAGGSAGGTAAGANTGGGGGGGGSSGGVGGAGGSGIVYVRFKV